MNTTLQWVREHDSGKLLVIGLAAIPVILLAILASNGQLFELVVVGGMICCGVGAYWLGNWKWILIPLVAMLAEIVIAIPFSLLDPNAVETPVSIVLESWFWAGVPAFIGAGVGYLIRRGSAAAAAPKE